MFAVVLAVAGLTFVVYFLSSPHEAANPVLDRVPKGRDEGDAFQTWIRRHDEYA